MKNELIEAWRTNNRINLMLIERISAEGMKCTLSTRGGRGVAGELAHIHNNRVWHSGASRGTSWRNQALEGGKVLEIHVAVRVHVERRQMGIQAFGERYVWWRGRTR